MKTVTECEKLAARFEGKAAGGLVDVKFFVRNADEAIGEAVCAEVNRLYEAVDNGKARALDFKDKRG